MLAATESSADLLAWLLQPIPFQDFVAHYFEKKALTITRDSPTHFSGRLFAVSDLTDLLCLREYYWGVHGKKLSLQNQRGQNSAVTDHGNQITLDSISRILRGQEGCVRKGVHFPYLLGI